MNYTALNFNNDYSLDDDPDGVCIPTSCWVLVTEGAAVHADQCSFSLLRKRESSSLRMFILQTYDIKSIIFLFNISLISS